MQKKLLVRVGEEYHRDSGIVCLEDRRPQENCHPEVFGPGVCKYSQEIDSLRPISPMHGRVQQFCIICHPARPSASTLASSARLIVGPLIREGAVGAAGEEKKLSV